MPALLPALEVPQNPTPIGGSILTVAALLTTHLSR